MKEYNIPVEWAVCDVVKVKANSFKEAVKYVLENKDEIPLGTEPEYIEGTYKINSEGDCSLTELDSGYLDELVEMLKFFGYNNN